MAWLHQYTGTADNAVNLSPATGAIAIFILKEALKQAGWVVQASSDATTHSAVADVITTGASGAGGLANNSAWFRIRSPEGSGGREFTFQRGTANTSWRIKLSHSAGFTGGSPGTTQTASATDEAILIGAGTDAAPSFVAWLGTDNTYKLHIGCDNAAPYDFYALFPVSGTGVTRRFWFLTMSAGSYPAADVAPYVVCVNTAAATHATMGSVSTSNANGLGQGWYKKGLSGEAFRNFRAGVPAGTAANYFREGLTNNPYSGMDTLLPVTCARVDAEAEPGWKGAINTGTLLWQGTARGQGDYVDVGAVRYAYFDEIAIRWPAGVTPSL